MAVVQIIPCHNPWVVLLVVAQVPATYPAEVCKQPGAVIESFMSHSPGVFSGTFSGTFIFWEHNKNIIDYNDKKGY